MTVPQCWSTTYAPIFPMATDTGVTDVNTIISSIRTQLTSTLTGANAWTESPTGTFKTPVDAAGRFMKIAVSRISATEIQFVVTDQNGNTVATQRIDIDAGGNNVNYFGSTKHLLIDSIRAGGDELFEAFILDPSPDLDSEVSTYVMAHGFRNSSGSAQSAGSGSGQSAQQFFMMQGTASPPATSTATNYEMNPASNEAATTIPLIMQSGRLIAVPVEVTSFTAGSVWRRCGRLPHMCLVDSSVGMQIDKSIPIDDATQATFRIIPMITTTKQYRFAVRKN